jgi:hypothetical protein
LECPRLGDLSPDSRYAVTHLYRPGDRFLGQLWEVQTGQPVREFDSPLVLPYELFSADGREPDGLQNAVVRIYDWQTGQAVANTVLA